MFVKPFRTLFLNVRRSNKLLYLVIFLNRNQPACFDMLQNELATIQRRIQEPFHIKERSLSDKI